MSDEKKEEKKEPQGCLVIMVVFLTVVLVLLVLVCYKKVEFSTLIPSLPDKITLPHYESPVQETKPKATKPKETKPKETKPKETKPKETKPETNKLEEDILAALDKIEEYIDEQGRNPTEPVTEKPQPTEPVTTKPEVTEPEKQTRLVVIDAGHQAKGNSEQEPIGPGATQKKAKVTSGTQGVVTRLEEYELNLQVATRLQKLLESRGYQVKMIRTGHDVNISNAQRAELANELKADVFIRIHANGDENSSTRGIMTICQTEDNPYNGALYPQCKKLSQYVLEEVVETTGGKKMFVWETDTMSGINWCQVPVTIVEMGYMTNPEEDKLLSTEEYQQKLAEGMANGIEKYFAG